MYTQGGYLFVLVLGMTDFQVLPPGLNSVLHNGVQVDPKDFQIDGKWHACTCNPCNLR